EVPLRGGLRRRAGPVVPLRHHEPRASARGFVVAGVRGGTTTGRNPMARPDKAATVAELTDRFRESNAAVLTEYRGLTVAQLKELRVALRGNATYAVVKNTLTAIAAKEAGLGELSEQ